MFDTRSFFTQVQTGGGGDDAIGVVKTKLALMVQLYGCDEVRQMYADGCHSALTDAWALSRIMYSPDLKDNFVQWLSSRLVSLSIDLYFQTHDEGDDLHLLCLPDVHLKIVLNFQV